jgi:hypothetical protein
VTDLVLVHAAASKRRVRGWPWRRDTAQSRARAQDLREHRQLAQRLREPFTPLPAFQLLEYDISGAHRGAALLLRTRVLAPATLSSPNRLAAEAKLGLWRKRRNRGRTPRRPLHCRACASATISRLLRLLTRRACRRRCRCRCRCRCRRRCRCRCRRRRRRYRRRRRRCRLPPPLPPLPLPPAATTLHLT